MAIGTSKQNQAAIEHHSSTTNEKQTKSTVKKKKNKGKGLTNKLNQRNTKVLALRYHERPLGTRTLYFAFRAEQELCRKAFSVSPVTNKSWVWLAFWLGLFSVTWLERLVYNDLWNEYVGARLKFVFSPDGNILIFCGWLGSKHQVTN